MQGIFHEMLTKQAFVIGPPSTSNTKSSLVERYCGSHIYIILPIVGNLNRKRSKNSSLAKLIIIGFVDTQCYQGL